MVVPSNPVMRKLIRLFSAPILLYGVSFLKGTFILGSISALFSGTSCLGPLMGAYLGLGGSFLYSLVKFVVAFFLLGKGSLTILVYHIPGLCASASWATRHAVVNVGIPVLCIAAFLAHPVGLSAGVLSLYWVVPIVIWMKNKKGTWAIALSSTFIAHAVGTVIWLYTHDTTTQFWWALVPLVAVERLIYAAGMVSIYTVVNYVRGCRPMVGRYATAMIRFLGIGYA